ncbi:MAG: hypothetical protein CL669_04940 [Balneola sp.]|nr:hypothetical protein [Balneola sp.]
MSTFKAKILTPVGAVFEGNVTGVRMPGTLGSFEVKQNHAPIVSTLQSGDVAVHTETGDYLFTISGDYLFTISGGVVEMVSNDLTLLADSVTID